MALNIKYCLGVISASLLSSVPVVGQDVNVSTFSPPQTDQMRTPVYPTQLIDRGEEGEVEIHLMVDTDGKPFEITAVNTSGSEDFSKAALRALESSTFVPAMADGKPTIGSYRTIYRFTIEDNMAASVAFARNYREFVESLQSEPREEVEETLAELESRSRNRYETTYVSMANFLFATKYGTPLQQMRYLDAALSFSREKSDVVHLPEDEARSARRELFKLRVTNRYFREALDAYTLIEDTKDAEGANLLRPVYEQVLALELDDSAFGVPVTLSENGLFNIRLLKHNVYIEQLDGKVAEFKARCDRQYVGFPVEPEISYNLPADWGVCSLEIIGDAGSNFTLVQH